MAFNSADINAFKDIWVFCEQRNGELMNTDFELISEGRKLADERGSQLVGILLGHNVEGLAKELGGYGADKVIVCDDPELEVYTTDAYTKVICDAAMDLKPEVILLGASNIGRDLGPRCAARLNTGLTADCTHLDIDMDKYVNFLETSSTLDLSNTKFDMEDVNLKMTRPAFGGHLMATIICPRFRPCMSTVRPGVMKKAPFSQERADACVVEKYPVALAKDDIKTQVLDVVKEAKQIVDLIGADVIPDDQKLVLEIAKVIRVGFLQQNAFHKDDTSVPLTKQFKMMETILYLYKKSKALIAMGMPMSVLKEDKIFDKIISIKYDVPNDRLDMFDDYKKQIDAFYEHVLERNA